MNILVTGAKGFVGKNLIASLENIRDGKDMVHQVHGCETPSDLQIYQYDMDNTLEELDDYCSRADFIFNLAGVNRPLKQNDYMAGNFGFASQLLELLKSHHNTCPVMLSSSIQASLQGRFVGSEYGISKKAGEELFQKYSATTGAKVLIYRFPNIFGKWCKPNYNSAIATFCNNIANDLPIQVNDPNVEMDLVYIDDVVEELINALNCRENKNGDYCEVPETHAVKLGEIVDLIKSYKESRITLSIPNMANPFEEKLYSTYLSYLPIDQFGYSLKMNKDSRGSFTEIIRTLDRGQFSVNIIKPGVTKGNHWHHTKNEKFVVVSGKGLIQFRKIGKECDGQTYPVIDYQVSGDEITVVDIPPGYTHNIINVGEIDLVTFMWSNECFNPEKPDTYFLNVKE